METDGSRCKYCNYGGVKQAQGYSLIGLAKGAVVMSNVVFSTALIELASNDATCSNSSSITNPIENFAPSNVTISVDNIFETTQPPSEGSYGVFDDDDDVECLAKVYGFTPASLISNIAVISGLMSAFLMPLIGAVVDFTPYRRHVGIGGALTMGLIQSIQIGLVQNTWFLMAILQAIAGFIYQVEIVATYAYLPEISNQVGHDKMATYTSKFQMFQFTSQLLFLLVVGVVGFVYQLDDVTQAQMSQAINSVWIAIFFFGGWRLMPNAPPRNTLPAGHSLWTEGFRQNYRTVQNINTNYRNGLRWFFLAVCFSEASANAFTTIAVVYLTESLGMDGLQIIIFFLITLLATIPGTYFASYITNKPYFCNGNFVLSWQLSQFGLMAAAIIGAFILDVIPQSKSSWAYVWGASLGFMLGWFYPTENLFFSVCLPKNCEAEMSGFFVYCSQILGWLPPLVFTTLVENQIAQKYGVAVTASFMIISIGLLQFAVPYNDIIQESKEDISPLRNENDNNDQTRGTHPSLSINDEASQREDDLEIP